MNSLKITSFTDLYAWQEGYKLVLSVYKITNIFPQNQQFSLVTQMQRAAISITSNIAEGFSRKTRKESKQCFFISLGSVTELQNQLVIARDLKFISQVTFKEVADQTIIVSKLINGLIKSAK